MGLTNYAAAYATGLLLARRHLTKLELADAYKGVEAIDGEDYNVKQEGDRAPFRAVLDIGLARTTTGAKVFAVMKGVADGGIEVPHRYNAKGSVIVTNHGLICPVSRSFFLLFLFF